MIHYRIELIAVHRFVLEQILGNELQLVGVLGEYLLCRFKRLVHYAMHLCVDLRRGLLRIIGLRGKISAEEYIVAVA